MNTCIQLLFRDHTIHFSYQHQTKRLQSRGTHLGVSLMEKFSRWDYAFRKDSRPTAHTKLLHSPKYSQAVSIARESTDTAEQPFKPSLNLSSLCGNSEELAVCPVLGKTLMSTHTYLYPKLCLTNCSPGAGPDWISCARLVTPKWLGVASAVVFLAVLMCWRKKNKKEVELNSMAFLVIEVLQKSPRSCFVTARAGSCVAS